MKSDNVVKPESWFVEHLALAYSAVMLWPMAIVALGLQWPGVPQQICGLLIYGFFGYIRFACISGFAALVFYAWACKPWRDPFSKAWFFWLHSTACAALAIGIADFMYPVIAGRA